MIERSIQEVFKNRKWSKKTERDFFEVIYSYLDGAVEKGFGKTFAEIKYNSADFTLLSNLKYNVASLSSFKNHSHSTELLKALIDDDDNVRTWGDFKKVAEKLNETYNKRWLKTEYDNAVAQSSMASRWLDFEKDKDYYPNLKYIQIQRDSKREAHSKFHGLILPLGHKFWDKHLPPNDWGCGCDVIQTNEKTETKSINFDDIPTNRAGFNINAGKHGIVVGKEHPYFNIKEYKAVYDKSFILYKQFKKEKYLPILREKFQGNSFKIGEKNIIITKNGLEHCLNDGHRRLALKNDLLLKLDEIINNLEYIGEAPDYKNRAKYKYVYYKLKGYDDMYIDIRYDTISKQYQLYSIGDGLDYLKK